MFRLIRATLCAFILISTVTFSQQEIIKLPEPKTEGGKPLMQALSERHSERNFSDKRIDQQTMSNLLWAAFGVNRPEAKKRTAPSAWNRQEVDIYVTSPNGVFLFDAFQHALIKISDKDIRGLTGTQDFVKTVPVNLVYVADLHKTASFSDEEAFIFPAISAGAIIQNVYLFCASEGLVTVARGLVENNKLAGELKLSDNQKIIMTQSVGYLAE